MAAPPSYDLSRDQLVELCSPDGSVALECRVERVAVDAVTLRVHSAAAAALRIGDTIQVRWGVRDKGVRHFLGTVLQAETTWRTQGSGVVRVPSTVAVSLPHAALFTQRRRFARVACAVPFGVRARGGGPWQEGRCRCLSAGGLRGELGAHELVGREVDVRLELSPRVVVTEGFVLRGSRGTDRAPQPGMGHLVAIAFEGCRRMEDRIAAWVLQAERRSLRARRDRSVAI